MKYQRITLIIAIIALCLPCAYGAEGARKEVIPPIPKGADPTQLGVLNVKKKTLEDLNGKIKELNNKQLRLVGKTERDKKAISEVQAKAEADLLQPELWIKF